MPRLDDFDVWEKVIAYLPQVGMGFSQKDMEAMERLRFPDHPNLVMGHGGNCWLIGSKNRIGMRYVSAVCPLSSYEGYHGDHIGLWQVKELAGLWSVTAMPGYEKKKRARPKIDGKTVIRAPGVMEIGAPVITGMKDGPAYVGRCVEVDDAGRCLRIETPFGFADARPLVEDGKGFVSVPSDRLVQGWAGVWLRQTESPSAETLRGYYGAASAVAQEEMKQAGHRLTKSGRIYRAKAPIRELMEKPPLFSGADIVRLAMEEAGAADPFLAWFRICWGLGVKAKWRDALAFETICKEM